MATGAQRGLKRVVESAWGVTPATPTMKLIRNTGGNGIGLGRGSILSGELRNDRGISDMRLGNKNPAIEIPYEFSYGNFDDFLELAMGGSFAAAYNLTGVTVDIDGTGKTISRSADSWLDDGIEVGDFIVTSGYTETGNNGTFEVTAVTDLVITLGNATGLVTDTTEVGAITTTKMKLIKGTSLGSMTLQESFDDLASGNKYLLMVGAMVNTLSMDLQPEAIITGAINMVGKDVTSEASDAASVTDAADTTVVMVPYEGSISIDGTEIGVVASMNWQLENGLEPKFPVSQDSAHHVAVGRSNITGNLSLFFYDATYLANYIAETEMSLKLNVNDPSGNGYTFHFPRIKLSGESRSIEENDITQEMPFQALDDSTEGSNLVIYKRPGSAA